jgi:hypothetical protein
MPKRDFCQPDAMLGVIYEEPDPAGARDLVLPLLKLSTAMRFALELALELVVTIGVDAMSRIGGEPCVHLRTVAGSDVAEPGPMLGCTLGGKA